MKETFEKEKEAAVQEATSLSSTKLAESLAEEREKWVIAQEEDMKRKIEEEVTKLLLLGIFRYILVMTSNLAL